MKKELYNKLTKVMTIALFSLTIFSNGCSKEENKETSSEGKSEVSSQPPPTETTNTEKGVGPVKNVEISASIDAKLVAEGKGVFDMKCSACHDINARKVGPALKGVTKRRKPEWVMNMIINPAEMTQKDPVAKKLLGEYMTQMANQNVNEKSARAILEYFRDLDKK